MKETVAIIDGGGRGSVITEKYLQCPEVIKVIGIPSNDWVKEYQNIYNKEVITYPNLKTTDADRIIEICRQEKISQVNVAQDNAIAAGLVDRLSGEKIPSFGPTKKAGEIEWNKAFSRRFLQKLNINQPNFRIFSSEQSGINYILDNWQQPFFIKASGLCEGKGALPAKNKQQAIRAIQKMKKFGSAGKTYLIEEWLQNADGTSGTEFSAFALTDGKDFKLLGTAKDHKRVYNFDEGENTGGMGCISPHPNLDKQILGQIEEIFEKTILGLKSRRRLYKGVLYLGGIVVERSGKRLPYVIEFNSRWGDPEAQSILPGIKNNFFELNLAAMNGDLKNVKIESDGLTRIALAGVTRGYPSTESKYTGKEIFGIDQAIQMVGIRFYGGGMKIVDGHYFTPQKPSRLFYVVGEGENIWEARTKAYGALREMRIPEIGLHYRTDICLTALSKHHPV